MEVILLLISFEICKYLYIAKHVFLIAICSEIFFFHINDFTSTSNYKVYVPFPLIFHQFKDKQDKNKNFTSRNSFAK